MTHNSPTQVVRKTCRLNFWLCLTLGAIFTLQPLPGVAASKTSKLKVVFLYNFAKYTNWPGDFGPNFNLCILGNDPFGDALDGIKNKTPQGKTLVFRKIASAEEASGSCQLLFISSTQPQDVSNILKILESRPILTVGEITDFGANGGMLNFVRKGTKQKFEVNQKAAAKAGLSFSSKLLKIGVLVN